MDRQEFQRIARRNEARAARHPTLYRLGIAARALFGFCFFYLLLVVAIACVVGGVALMIGDPNVLWLALIGGGLYGVYHVGRAIAFRLPPPTGINLTRPAMPDLWAFVDALRAKTRRPRVHAILLTSDLGAAIVQNPRRGLVTGYRNYLICGLPLMLGLTREQFAAIVAHELGHIARGHGALGAWVHRLHRVWERTLEQTRQRPRHPIARFVRWYAPRFAAQTYVLRRRQEIEADRVASDVLGPDAPGDALILTYLRDGQGREFWEETWRRTADTSSAPVDVMDGIRDRFARLPEESALRRELAESLAWRTIEFDTHPSLSDRLASLDGYLAGRGVDVARLRGDPAQIAGQVPIPQFAPPSAAQALFGAALPALMRQVAESWAADASASWDAHHQRALRNSGRLALLDRRASAGEALSPDEAFERVQMVESLRGEAAALEAYAAVPTHPVPHAATLYSHGRLLLRRSDPAGVAMVEQAMGLDPEAVIPGAQLLFDYHSRNNDHARADALIGRMDAHDREVALARKERDFINANDQYEPHQFADDDVRRIVGLCRTLAFVRQAYLVRRACHRFPEMPAHALIVTVQFPWWAWRPRRYIAAIYAELGNQLHLQKPATHFVIPGGQQTEAIRTRLKRMKDHRIYDADADRA